ncbi:MAG: DNA-binding protein, partial [Bacteroidetes bacterium]|nr:DNA-binding protein [Bacteroidota bacterium]
LKNRKIMSEEIERTEREDLFSKAVKAGKRTYFFDVKSTRGNDYYLTITESKKRFGTDGKFTYEKHKIFLYKEDFEKFMEGLNESIEVIKENAPPIVEREAYTNNESSYDKGVSPSADDVNFEDLGK